MTILVAGEALIDVIQHPDGSLTAVAGGGPYNTARTIARLGQPVSFTGCLSRDRFGWMLRDALAADGVDLSYAVETDDPTTLAMAEIGADGSARYSFYTAATSAAVYSLDDIPASFEAVAAVEMGSLGLVLQPTADALVALAERLPGTIPLMIDPNCRPSVIPDADAYRARIARVLARADVAKASTEDLDFLFPGSTPDEAARAILALGPTVVLVTDGPHDLRVVTPQGTFSEPVPPIAVVDTIGAGDSFGGGFLAWWVGHDRTRGDLADHALLRAAVRFGIRVAGVTTGRAGADPPTLADLGGWGD